jgi:parallel beta-helix repeat protein
MTESFIFEPRHIRLGERMELLRKPVFGVMLTLLLIGMLALSFNIQPVKASGTVYIRADGSIDPPTAPISTVDNFTYTLTGNITSDTDGIVVERSSIIIDGAGYTIQGTANGVGITLPSMYNVTIKNVRVKDFEHGIDLFACNSVTITNNTVADCTWGILARWGSLNNTIMENNVTNGYVGINLSLSANSTIAGNRLNNNTEGVRLYYYSGENIVINNTIVGNGVALSKGIFLYQDAENCTVSNNTITNTWAGIHLIYRSNNNTISHNKVTRSQYGMLLGESSNNTLSYNDISSNDWGIYITDSANNTITDNNITANFWSGVDLSGSSGNVLIRNNITSTATGIYLYYSSNNKIYHNNFINAFPNSYQSINVWDEGYPSGGNYWSDYNSTDLYKGPYQNQTGSDGIGDTPYIIDENNVDKYPLIAPTYISIFYFNLTITSTVGGTTDPTSGIYTYVNGTLVTITAIPDLNYVFEYWILDGVNVGSQNPIEILMDSNHTLQAIFAQITYHQLTITSTEGGTTDPAPGIYTYVEGTNVQVTAIPDVNYRFAYWELDGSNIVADNPVTVLMNKNRTLHAVFAPNNYTLAITVFEGGTTTPAPGTHTYVNGTVVSVTAIPHIGYSFDYWRLDGEVRTDNPIIVLMDMNHTLEAFFIDDAPPDIAEPVQEPPEDIMPYQNVTVTVNVTDFGTGVYNVTLWYSIDNGTTWIPLNMTEISSNTYQATIPRYDEGTWVTYEIVAYDNAGNSVVKDNNGYHYKYHVIPEFTSTMILLMLMLTTLIATFLQKKRKPRTQLS